MTERFTITLASSAGTDLSSRARAAVVRRQILSHIVEGSPVIIDLEGVRAMSESFADELFGILAAKNGDEWFRKWLSVRGASEGARINILRAIDERLKRAGMAASKDEVAS